MFISMVDKFIVIFLLNFRDPSAELLLWHFNFLDLPTVKSLFALGVDHDRVDKLLQLVLAVLLVGEQFVQLFHVIPVVIYSSHDPNDLLVNVQLPQEVFDAVLFFLESVHLPMQDQQHHTKPLENVERGLILLYFLEQREVEVLAER
jgi:hypothetical protein